MEIEETFKLLEEGEREIVLDNDHRDNIIVLGNTGSGKSTLTLFLAADNSRLIAQETIPGSGSYVIIDNDKIGNSTTESKTLVPDLMVDPNTNIGYYDCPGFLDTRTASHDIASTYFIKKVIDFSQTVKLVFVVNHSSVKKGYDRQDFQTLVRHIVTLVKDVSKYSGAISLIATKAENKIILNPETGKYELVPDVTVIKAISDFLLEFRGSLIDGILYPQDPDLREKALVFVDVLLYEKNGTYPRIGIFRQPDRPGPLSESSLLQENKKQLNQVILNETHFISKDDDDFGYTISDRTQNSVYELVQEINRRITNVSFKIAIEIKKHYDNQIELVENIYKLQATLDLGYEVWFPLVDEAASITSPQEYVNKIVENAQKTTIPISDDSLQYLVDQSDYFNFFEEVSGKKQEIYPLSWANGMKSAVSFLQRSKNWYSFLINLFRTLSTFNYQEDATLYNVADINNWGLPDNNQGIRITDRNIKTFLEKLEKDNINGYNDVKDLTDFSDFELRDLNNVLEVTLVQRPSLDCKPSDKLVVKGNFVKLSDTSSINCTNIKKLEVYALNTFFVDVHLDKSGDKFQIGIVAPTWEVTKDALISMEGKPGDNQNKPEKVVSPSGKGIDGKPGLPGSSGGAFFGIGDLFFSGKKLVINSTGGPGGGGQEGGDGGDGHRGADPYLPQPRYWPGTNFKFYVVGDLKFRYKHTGHRSYTNNFGTFIENYYDVYGDTANGGDGGDGGVGGLGGNGGNITIVALERSSEIAMISNKGLQGSGRVGGKGGNPGRDGDTLKTTLFSSNLFPNSDWQIKDRLAGATSNPGKAGTGDKNDKGFVQPEISMTFANPYETIVDYKTYLRNNLKDPIQRQSLTEFLEKLDGNYEIKQLYSTLGLTSELLSLENQFYQLTREINVMPLYESIRQRIYDYAENPLPGEKNIQYKKVLNYIYSATLSKICSLNNSKDGNLIIDISGYLKLAKDNINKLNEIGKQAAINQYKAEYQAEIDKKIIEALDFIENKIKPEIDFIGQQIDANIDALIIEVINLINDAHANLDELRRKQKELERAMNLKVAFGLLGAIGQGIGFLGPWGNAVGGVIGVTTSVAGSFVLDSSGNIPGSTIPSGVISLLNTSKETLEYRNKQKLAAINEEIDKLNKEIKKYPELLNDLEPKLNELKDKAETTRPGDDTTELENELIEALEGKRKELEDDKTSSKEQLEGSLKIINGVSNAMTVVQTTVDVFNTYKKDQQALNEIAKAIKQQEEQIKALMQYQKDIENIIIPLVNQIKIDIEEIEKQLEGQSHVALDVTKWEIQSNIRDMKSLLEQFTEGFQVQENLSRSIEKLDDAMDTLINVYDRIQNYQDQQRLAVYIADISSPPAHNIIISDPKLRKAVDDLDFVIQSGIVYAQYKRAVNAFQQWVFPFADYYFEDFEFPANLQVNNSIQDLAFTAGRHIDVLQAKLEEYKVSIIKGHDEFIIRTQFYSNYTSTNPFFVWNNKNYNHEISQLLSGKQVIFNANVLKASDKNSVKFNLAEIRFKVQNEAIQKELDSVLNNFQVFMTHMGSSLYRCDGRYFIIISENQLINYSFERDSHGQPLITNKVYEKIKNGDLTLSPYVLWGLQLNKTTNMGFDRLNPYKHLIDVELVGLGQYVSQDSNICNHKLTNYYQLLDSVSEIDNVRLTHNVLQETKIQRYRREIESTSTQHKFAYSSGTKSSSPINYVFKWFTAATENLVKSIGSWFRDFPSLSGPEKHSNHWTVSSYSYDLNSSLMLTDLLIRKFTKEKFFIPKENSLSTNEAQGLVLEIVAQFEEELEKLGTVSEFDPLSVQKELMYLVINENYSKITEVLCKSVKLDFETERKITKQIVKTLKEEFKNVKQNAFSYFNSLPNELINAVVINEHQFTDKIGESASLFLQ